MKLLLDTCILSELRGIHTHPTLLNLFESSNSNDLYISLFSIGEIVKGIQLLTDKKRQFELQEWLQKLLRFYNNRILSPNLEVSYIWGELTAICQKKGKLLPTTDGWIAATAMHYGLHVVTRNASDFQETGVLVINPWD